MEETLVRVEVIEGVFAVELAEGHDDVVHVLATHHNQVAEERAGVEQSDAELQVHLVQVQVRCGNVINQKDMSPSSRTFSQRWIAPPFWLHLDLRLRARVTVGALREVMEFMVDELAGFLIALHVGLHVWDLVFDYAVICRSGRKRLAEKARVLSLLILIMITSSIEMRDVVAHIALVDATVGVRDRCFTRGPVEGAPVVLNEPADREGGGRVRQHKDAGFRAERMDVHVDDVRRFYDAVGGS